MDYLVKEIPKKYSKDWLLNKHYAKRMPNISLAFGIFDENGILSGVCTFGTPCRNMNNGKCLFKDNFLVKTFELTRLVINENFPKNTLSYFVSQCLKQLPQPCCVVSYADSNMNHHGYIYQATNWHYTGITNKRRKFVDSEGKDIHERTIVSRYGSSSVKILKDINDIKIVMQNGKHRYFQFVGNKRDKKIMLSKFIYPIFPYPKGDNQRYDSSYSPKSVLLTELIA